MGKMRGVGTARKLKPLRREERWADKDYKKCHIGYGSDANKCVVLKNIGIEGAKQQSSATHKCRCEQLYKNGKKLPSFIIDEGCQHREYLLAANLTKNGKKIKVVKDDGHGVSRLVILKEKEKQDLKTKVEIIDNVLES